MPIKLDWVDHRVNVQKHKIYRALQPIDIGNLGTALDEVAGTVKTYTDKTVQRGVTYYYIVTSVVDTDEAPSAQFCQAYIPNTGPGPSQLQRGTWTNGYFGRVPFEDILSVPELYQALGINTNPALPDMTPSSDAINNSNYYHKMVLNGKILFIPVLPVGNNFAWPVLYRLGLVYGDKPEADWNANVKSYLGVVPQNKIVTGSGGNRFIVRLPTAKANPVTQTGVTLADQQGGEFDTVISRNYLSPAYTQFNNGKTDDSTMTGIAVGTPYNWFTQDYRSGTGASILMCTRQSVTIETPDTVNVAGVAITSAVSYWRPVLEFVP